MSEVKKVGAWSRVGKLLASAPKRMRAAVDKALLQEAQFFRTKIVEGIREQAPGGKAFAPLAPTTLAIRRFRGFKGTKALLVQGDLRNSITVVKEGDRVFVGVLRSAKGRAGQKLVDVASVHDARLAAHRRQAYAEGAGVFARGLPQRRPGLARARRVDRHRHRQGPGPPVPGPGLRQVGSGRGCRLEAVPRARREEPRRRPRLNMSRASSGRIQRYATGVRRSVRGSVARPGEVGAPDRDRDRGHCRLASALVHGEEGLDR